MISAYSTFLAQRYLFSRWVNVLGTVGVAVAVWALIVVVAVFSGFIGEIRRNIRGATPDLLLSGLADGTSFEAVDEVLRDDPDVASTAPRLRHYGMYYPYGRRTKQVPMTRSLVASQLAFDFVQILGIDPELEARTTSLHAWLDSVDRAALRVADPERPLAVDRELEERGIVMSGRSVPPGGLLKTSPGLLLGLDRIEQQLLEPGQRVGLVTARFVQDPDDGENLVVPVKRYLAIAGAFETRHRVFDNTTALISIWELRDMLGHPYEDPQSIDIVSDVAIRVRPGADLATVAMRLEQSCAEFGGHALTWEEQNRVFLGAVDQERGMMKLILFAVMLVAAFLIYATLHMMVTQKIKDIGVLCSMGATPRGILAIFLTTGAIVGVAGCVLGVVGGCLSAYYLNDVNDWTKANFGVSLFPTELYALDEIPYQIEPGWIVQVVVGALAISFVAAFLPARRAAHMEPVQALAYE